VHGLLIIVAGGVVLLAARSSPGLLLVGLAGLGLGWGRALLRRRGMTHPAWAALGTAAATWLLVVGADLVQRHRFSDMAALAGTSLALLSLSAAWLAAHPVEQQEPTRPRRPGRMLAEAAAPLLLALAAHAWVGAWWALQWLPGTAWWALASVPLSLAAAGAVVWPAGAGGQSRWAAGLMLAAAVAHGLLQTAALLAVASLR
jgi:1,4-dihydroxy-2-naphthoate octaprenyltransferase